MELAGCKRILLELLLTTPSKEIRELVLSELKKLCDAQVCKILDLVKLLAFKLSRSSQNCYIYSKLCHYKLGKKLAKLFL